ncbi:MAG TPA: patatin-like phospholipase family protein [Thermoanaerobaculia bacterium]
MSDPRRTQALVLSGGGANGAYEVGVLKALLNGKCRGVEPVDPELFFGTSVGSYNASFLVSQWEQYGTASISNLEQVWLEVLAGTGTTNGGFRFRGDPGYYLNPASYVPNPVSPFLQFARDSAYLAWDGLNRAVHLATTQDEALRERIAELFNFSSFISVDPWRETIRRTIDFTAIRRCDTRKLRIFGTNWATGRLRTFRNQDMTDNLGLLAILASSATPGVFPVVDVGAEPFVDGGVLMNTPLRPAMDEGADILHVIYLDPDIAAIPLSALESTVASTYRLQTISWAALVNREIARARRINRGLAVFEKLRRGESLGVPELDALAKGAVMLLGGRHPGTYRPITIHRYTPHEELGGGALGMLNLDRDHVEDLIERGFADASMHDCQRACCVIPGQDDPECAKGEPG